MQKKTHTHTQPQSNDNVLPEDNYTRLLHYSALFIHLADSIVDIVVIAVVIGGHRRCRTQLTLTMQSLHFLRLYINNGAY